MSSEPDQRSILEQLGHVAAELGPMLSPAGHDELLEAITAAAREMFGAAACSLALLDNDTDELVFHVASGSGDVVGLRVPVGEGIAGWVAASGQSIAIDDLAQDPRFAEGVAASTGYVPHSILAMPLETEREMLGVIEILDPHAQLGGNELALLGLFARQAALALESARVFDDLGRMLFAAAANATDAPELANALEQLAATTSGPTASLAQLAAHISELSRLGTEERDAATQIVGAVLAYARSRNR